MLESLALLNLVLMVWGMLEARQEGIKKTAQHIINWLRLLTDNTHLAGVAQLVERQLPKLNVASSNLVSRLKTGPLFERSE